MIGAALMLSCVVAAVFLITEGWRAYVWHHRGAGERTARAEHSRLRREQADTAEARLPETEYVRYRVDLRPGALRYVIAVLLLLLIGLPASCALMNG